MEHAVPHAPPGWLHTRSRTAWNRFPRPRCRSLSSGPADKSIIIFIFIVIHDYLGKSNSTKALTPLSPHSSLLAIGTFF